MEIQSPKEMVANIVGTGSEQQKSIFALKSKATLNGAFFGGVFGFVVAHQMKKSLYVGILAGVLVGGFISNILTVKKNNENLN